jgi:hypothetical protein
LRGFFKGTSDLYAIRVFARIGGKLEALAAKMQLGLAQKTLEFLQFGPLFPGNRRLTSNGTWRKRW